MLVVGITADTPNPPGLLPFQIPLGCYPSKGSNPGGFGVSAVMPTTGTLTINLNSISISRVLRGSTPIYLSPSLTESLRLDFTSYLPNQMIVFFFFIIKVTFKFIYFYFIVNVMHLICLLVAFVNGR